MHRIIYASIINSERFLVSLLTLPKYRQKLPPHSGQRPRLRVLEFQWWWTRPFQIGASADDEDWNNVGALTMSPWKNESIQVKVAKANNRARVATKKSPLRVAVGV